MSICGQCGHPLGDGRFCTQCGTRAATPERSDTTARSARNAMPAMAGAASGGPSATPASTKARYPLFAEAESAEPGHESLAETAVRPMASLGPSTPAPEVKEPALGDRVGALADRVGAEAKRWFATADPTWVTVLTVGVGGMLVALILGMILLLH